MVDTLDLTLNHSCEQVTERIMLTSAKEKRRVGRNSVSTHMLLSMAFL